MSSARHRNFSVLLGDYDARDSSASRGASVSHPPDGSSLGHNGKPRLEPLRPPVASPPLTMRSRKCLRPARGRGKGTMGGERNRDCGSWGPGMRVMRWSLRMRQGGRYEPWCCSTWNRTVGRPVHRHRQRGGWRRHEGGRGAAGRAGCAAEDEPPRRGLRRRLSGVARPGRYSHCDRHTAPLAPQAGGYRRSDARQAHLPREADGRVPG